MSFFQAPPALANQYETDALLREYLERTLPPDVRAAIESELHEMGELSGGVLAELSYEARHEAPELVQFDPWGHRIDAIRVPRAWQTLAKIACERGLVAIPYERRFGPFSRLHQFALAYLFAPSSSFYSCPLAMTDGAARALEVHGNAALLERAFPRLTSREPSQAWTSGQWMTERTGGSDVGLTETVARREGDQWRLFGTKWFTSATTSEMALTLARPVGNPQGGKGLALFFVELRDERGLLNGIRIHRLKEKLGTRLLPTAELELDGTLAIPVAGLDNGVRAITPMLQITRSWNALCAVGSMRRGIALSTDYATRRVAFGATLSEKPLHRETLAELGATFEADFLLAARAFELLGREETGQATEEELLLSRLLQPIVKLLTAKDAVANASEVLEAMGGAGYVEDTGLPVLLRDAQVFPIWEGTTNVLSLDVLRAVKDSRALEILTRELARLTERVASSALKVAAGAATHAVMSAIAWYDRMTGRSEEPERGPRAFALTLGRSYSLALLVDHAQWLFERGVTRSAEAAPRLTAWLGPHRAALDAAVGTFGVA